MPNEDNVLIVGGGIGGLTLALQLHQAGIDCRVLERAPELRPLGVGINLLPHASKELCALGLESELDKIGVRTSASVFFNRFGQHIYADPAGTSAGYPWPQYSIHRGHLQDILAETVRRRLGESALVLDAGVTGLVDGPEGVLVETKDAAGKTTSWNGNLVVACDGVHSTVRRFLHPDEGALRYSGYTMWRGTARLPPFLDGASMVRAGWLETGKLVVYPIRGFSDATQLINWVAEVKSPQRSERDWNQRTDSNDFAEAFADWTFDWLDVPAMIAATDEILEYPMVDQEPLPFWSRGRVTLMGDAAHPMLPRGSNGAGQAILDTRSLCDALAEEPSTAAALTRYEGERMARTAEVVRLNGENPPDAILRMVFERTGDQPFADRADVVGDDELAALLDNYRTVTGSSLDALR